MDKKQAGKLAADHARQETLKILQEKGPSLQKTLLRLKQALNAKTVKVFKASNAYDRLIYSKPLVDHAIRLKAIDILLKLYDSFPAEKLKHEGEVTLLAPYPIKKPKNAGKSGFFT